MDLSDRIQEQARLVMEALKSDFGQVHVFRQTDSKNFRQVNQKFYRLSQSRLEALGFYYLADVEDATRNKEIANTTFTMRLSSWWDFVSQPITNFFRKTPFVPNFNIPTFTRVMVSSDHGTIANICHFPLPRLVRALLNFIRLYPQSTFHIGFETEFSDGTFLVTSNPLERASRVEFETPGVHRQRLPGMTNLEQIFQQHQHQLDFLLSSGISFNPINSYEDAEDMQRRAQTLENSYRESVGYITDEEIERIYEGDRELTEVFKIRFAKLRRENKTEPRS